MKKKIIMISIGVLILVIGIFIGTNINKEASFDDGTSKPKQIVNENTLSMMIEQTAGAGDYKLETRSSWPTDGYKFNATLSKCENGGELGWDETNKVVTMTGNMSDKCYIYFDKYSTIKINSYTIEASSNNINITINAEDGTAAIAKYFYSKDGGATYVESTSNTYTFSSLNTGTYSVKAYVQDANGKNSTVLSKSVEITAVTLASYIKSLYTGTQGSNNIYYYDSTLSNGAGDSSYRYAGASSSVNNYVCFGSDADTCPTDNLYRIIGVFGDQVKLIKADFANSNLLGTDGSYNSSTYAKSSYSGYTGAFDTINRYYWNNSSYNNTWSESNLNTVNLNKNFYNSFDDIWKAKIAKTTWKVGGNTWANIGTVKPATAYKNEITNPDASNSSDSAITYGPKDNSKIGLMYVTDYEFAASPSAWTLLGYSSSGSSYDYRSATSINWMYMGIYEWTISRDSDDSDYVFPVSSGGNVQYYDVGNWIGVRPVFYLVSSATYLNGTGTSSDPIRIG